MQVHYFCILCSMIATISIASEMTKIGQNTPYFLQCRRQLGNISRGHSIVCDKMGIGIGQLSYPGKNFQ